MSAIISTTTRLRNPQPRMPLAGVDLYNRLRMREQVICEFPRLAQIYLQHFRFAVLESAP